MIDVTSDMFERSVVRRLSPYRRSQALGEGVDAFVGGLRRAAAREAFVSPFAAQLWLDTMVDHFLAAQSHGECAQHSMMVLTQNSLQAMLSVRHTVMDNAMTNKYLGSLVPHLSKSVLCPIKHPTACTMLLASVDGSYEHTLALAKVLEYRLLHEFFDGNEPRNVRVLREEDHGRLFRVARLVHQELFGKAAPLVGVCLELHLSVVRCALAHAWPSEFATQWNHAHGAECLALARDRPCSVCLFLSAPDSAEARVVEIFSAAHLRKKKKPAARSSGAQAESPESVARAREYAMQRILAAEGGVLRTDDAAMWALILRRQWLPEFCNARALGVVGIQAAWVARYVCPMSRAPGEARRFCVKTRGANLRAVVGGVMSVLCGGLADRSTAATDDLSSTTGMGLFGVDTAVAYLCHDEVARANGALPEHLFTLGMLLSHTGSIANVSGKGYVRLGADFCGQIAVEDIRSALHQAALGVAHRPGSQPSKAAAIMFGRQTGDGTNVSRYEWCPEDDACVTQAEAAAADPASYGAARPLLSALHRHWESQRKLHHMAPKRATSPPPPDSRRAAEDPAAVMRRVDALTVVVA